MMLEPDPGRRPARMSDVIRLIDDPRLIPAQYGGTDEDRTVLGLVRPVAGFQPAGGVPGYTQPTGPGWSATGAGQTGGYQAGYPGTMQPGLQTMGAGTGIGAAGAQPYRPAFVGGTQAGVTGQPGLSMPPGYSAPPGAPGAATQRTSAAPKQGGGAGKLVLAALVLAAAGAGGFGWQQGWFGAPAAPVADPAATAESDATTPPAADSTADAAPAAAGRDAWLAAAVGDTACTFAQRVGGGPRSGAIDLFANRAAPLPDLSSGFAAEFGSRPDVTDIRVTDAQCAVLDLARQLQATAGVAPVTVLDTPTLGPGGTIVGRISERRGRAMWLGLVTPTGQVFSLTQNMTDQPDGSATFNFGLATELPAGSAPQVHLIVALASDDPLLTTASAAPGAQAAALMGLLSAELGRATVPGGMAVQSFLLTP
jgi:serine/threonine-protein kinase